MVPVTGRGWEWAVPARVVGGDEIDARLLRPAGRTGLVQVVADHDMPAVGRCPGCGWSSVSRRRDCPSRVIALALLENTPLPARLVHLVEVVPGVRAGRDTVAERDAARVREDGLPGLFAAPARVPERRSTQ